MAISYGDNLRRYPTETFNVKILRWNPMEASLVDVLGPHLSHRQSLKIIKTPLRSLNSQLISALPTAHDALLCLLNLSFAATVYLSGQSSIWSALKQQQQQEKIKAQNSVEITDDKKVFFPSWSTHNGLELLVFNHVQNGIRLITFFPM